MNLPSLTPFLKERSASPVRLPSAPADGLPVPPPTAARGLRAAAGAAAVHAAGPVPAGRRVPRGLQQCEQGHVAVAAVVAHEEDL